MIQNERIEMGRRPRELLRCDGPGMGTSPLIDTSTLAKNVRGAQPCRGNTEAQRLLAGEQATAQG